MKSEETIYDNLNGKSEDMGTRLDDNQVKETKQNKEEDKTKNKSSVLTNTAIGLGSGVLLGSITSFMLNNTAANAAEVDGEDGGVNLDGNDDQTPAWSDGNVTIAEGVNDEMSFAEAFSTAREEIGPGGVFEWNGNVYSTYLAEEWNAMSQEERDEFNDHFSWNHASASSASETEQTAQTETSAPTETSTQTETPAQTEVTDNNTNDVNTQNEDDMEIGDIAETQQEVVDVSDAVEPGMPNPVDEPDVEILGVVYDEELEANVGVMTVDNQDVILIDADLTDENFEIAVADLNHNEVVEEGEIEDISDLQISVNEFESASMMGQNDIYYTSNDVEPDYVNDADVIA